MVALKKQMCREIIIIGFYTTSVIWFIAQIITMNINKQFFYKYELTMSTIFLSFYSILFIADLLTLCYFVRMSENFIAVLQMLLTIDTRKLRYAMYSMAIWIVITWIRYELLYNIAVIISES